MKKFFAIAITLMMVLSLGVFAADYEVDIASITDASDDVVVDFTDAGYTGKVIKFTNGTGLNANLGAIDLSLYSKVVFTYGSDPGAYYDTADSVYLEDAEGNMIGSFAPSAPTGFWASMERQSEIVIDTDPDGKLIWRCPNCGNTEQTKMNVARRTCGYIGSQFWNQGRTQEIKDRVLHL